MAATTASPRFLALGDSYTIGEGVAAEARWPALLARQLRADGVAIADPEIVAVTGWTTDELDAAMDTATFAPPYALVTLLIGVNNQYRGRDADNYRVEFGVLLQRALALAADPAHVVVISIPDWGVTRFAHREGRDATRIAAELDAFNRIAHDAATQAGAVWVDVTATSRACADAADMLADDGLHPSAMQYALWTRHILPAARAALREPAFRPHATG